MFIIIGSIICNILGNPIYNLLITLYTLQENLYTKNFVFMLGFTTPFLELTRTHFPEYVKALNVYIRNVLKHSGCIHLDMIIEN